jgi:glutamine amidotransferase
MQLLFDSSEEGEGEGIGLIPGTVRRLKARVVPQMGWNDVDLRPDPLFRGLDTLVAYYANSFVCNPVEEGCVIATSRYDEEVLAAGVRKNRSWGVQFHPEKSSSPGLRIIQNFLEEIS